MLNTILDSITLSIISFYLIMSMLTFIIYAMDKSAAIKGNWRIKESTLHLLSLVGGWPGALMAQQTLKHKSIKQPFRFVFWLSVLLNVALLTGWFMLFFDVNDLQMWVSKMI